MRIVFAGDWHGNSAFAARVIAAARDQGADRLVQLGDFGFWPGGDNYLIALSAMCEERNIDLYVIHGNHDDPNRWQYLEPDYETGFCPIKDSEGSVLPRMWFIRDGFTWDWDGLSFGAIGGAASIDREYRLDLYRRGGTLTWWPEEVVTPEAVRDLVYQRMDGTCAPLDVLISHDGPTWSGSQYNRGMRIPVYDQARSAACRALIDCAATLTHPYLHLHGHHHNRAIGYAPWHTPNQTRRGTGLVIALHADIGDSVEDNTYILDTADVPALYDPPEAWK